MPTATQAKEWSTLKNNEIIILHSKALKPVAEEVTIIYPRLKSELEKILKLKLNFSPTIILEDNHDNFFKMSGHPLVLGFAIPDRSLIVIDYSKVIRKPYSLESIIKHELCHLLLHYYIDEKKLPKWFDEGVAQWVSGGIADILMADHTRLDRAIVTGRYIRIKSLENTFPRKDEYLILAYEESKSIVDYIVSKYGPEGILKIIYSLQKDDNINQAVLASFSMSFDELEKNWYGSVKENTTWLILLTNHLYEILFFFAGVSLIIAYIKILIRKRSLRDEEDSTTEREY